MFVIYSDLNLR